MHILVAEDDFPSRKAIMRHLAQYGECDAAVDGMETTFAYMMALDDKEYYDLICLDVMMPVLDGFQALKTIRDMEEERDVPEEKRAKVIMMTALNDAENMKKARELGCTEYCSKPVDYEKFDALLHKLALI